MIMMLSMSLSAAWAGMFINATAVNMLITICMRAFEDCLGNAYIAILPVGEFFSLLTRSDSRSDSGP